LRRLCFLGGGFADEPVPVRLALLAAVGNLFFKRPPECQRLLGSVLYAALADPNQDIHDRALLYYRYACTCHYIRKVCIGVYCMPDNVEGLRHTPPLLYPVG
jgi:hypothetical protein